MVNVSHVGDADVSQIPQKKSRLAVMLLAKRLPYSEVKVLTLLNKDWFNAERRGKVLHIKLALVVEDNSFKFDSSLCYLIFFFFFDYPGVVEFH